MPWRRPLSMCVDALNVHGCFSPSDSTKSFVQAAARRVPQPGGGANGMASSPGDRGADLTSTHRMTLINQRKEDQVARKDGKDRGVVEKPKGSGKWWVRLYVNGRE